MKYDTFADYFYHQKGILANGIALGAFISTTPKSKEIDWPEIQIHEIPQLLSDNILMKSIFHFSDEYWNFLQDALRNTDGASSFVSLLRPKSR